MNSSKENGGFTLEFKQQALALADEMGVRPAAESLVIRPTNIYRWRKELVKDGEHAFRGTKVA